jgi:2-dehydro-3-deoxygluconokinase
MKQVITFGEIMLRLGAGGEKKLTQTDVLNVGYAGAEANVAVALAQLGIGSRFVTKLPDGELAQKAINAVRAHGAEVAAVRGDGRTGLMFFEQGAGQRPSKVIYDRAESAIARARESDFDFAQIFDGTAWFHLTGITPALSGALAGICLSAVKTAKKKGATVSFDTNYRSKLWSVESAAAVLPSIAKYADVITASDWDAKNIFGYGGVAELIDKLKPKAVAHTVRVEDGSYSGVLYKDGKRYESKKHALCTLGRIGAGDAFSAGLIYALINNFDNQSAIDFAAASGALKHTVEGDFNLCSASEIQAVADGGGGGLQR